MKNKKKDNFLHAEDAQSVVVGFVLIIGIITAASSIYFSTQVPDWTKDYESLHTADVADDFSELKSLIDGIVLKGEGGALAAGSTPIKMTPDKVPIFGMSPPGSSFNFLPDDGKFEIIADVGEGGGGAGGRPWEQNSFTDPNATYYRVDNSSNELKLAKITYDYPNLILDDPSESERLENVQYYDQVVITNGGTLYVAIGFLKLVANNITVGPGGNIIADGKGSWGGTNDRDGKGLGGGTHGESQGGGGGAGYGGDGGDGGNGGDGGDAYGNATSNSSIQQGSGGGGGATGKWGGGSGGNGGGAIWLDAEEINISGGTISVNGDDGLDGCHHVHDGGGGGGSGGGILIHGRNVTISGTISANGGDGGSGSNSGGGGGGGRIKIFHDSSYTGPSSSSDPSVNVSGGNGGNSGDNGTFHEEQTTYTSAIPYVEDGYYISEVYDTGNDSTCYGNMTWNADLNGQRIVMRVRTSMVAEMEGNATLWENCPAVSNGEDISDLSSASDGHRYVQYRAELYTEDTYTTPILHSVNITYSYSALGGGSPILASSSGIIKFNSNYLYYPNQEIAFEHGAVIKCQDTDEVKRGVMLYPGNRSHLPGINITNESGIPALRISMVDLTGSNYSYSGSIATSIENSFNDYSFISDNLKYPNLTLNFTTDYYSVWSERFNKTLEESGLDDSYYNVSPDTDGYVEVKFYGHGDCDCVRLYLEETVVKVEV